jgi:RNA polymerase-interacting CarD/CdnL/TRCF family regulator
MKIMSRSTWSQRNGKGTTTSRSESPTEKKNMVKELYKVNEKINQSKLYEHFTKLLDQNIAKMDDDIKRTHRLIKKLTKQLKLE